MRWLLLLGLLLLPALVLGAYKEDFNTDNEVNILDLVLLAKAISSQDLSMDIKIDGEINIFDLILLVKCMGKVQYCTELNPPIEPPIEPPIDPPTDYDVAINPGENIQTIVNANPPGTAFLIKAGTHRGQKVDPKDDNTFIGEPGAILDGNGNTDYAFGHYGLGSKRVHITGLIIQNYDSGNIQQGAIFGDNTLDWIVEGNEVRNNNYGGVRLGDGMIVRNNNIHDNSNVGIGAFKSDNVLVENNNIVHNGFAGLSGEHSGMKILVLSNAIVRNNYVYNNVGRGIWLDTFVFDSIVENNEVIDNTQDGIWVENCGEVIVRNNHVEGNGLGNSHGGWLYTPGIAITNSPNVEVYGNTVKNNNEGIGAMQATGYPAHDTRGFLHVENLYVHDNTITMQQGRTGLVTNWGDNSYYNSRNNRFDRNTYCLGTNSKYFFWNNAERTEAEWKAAGQDANSDFNCGEQQNNNLQPNGPSGNWNLIFQDEFDGTTLDKSKWNLAYPWSNTIINNELQMYDNDPDISWQQGNHVGGHVVLNNGILELIATDDEITDTGGWHFDYISGAITSYKKFDFKYGVVEFKAKVPEGRGLWPALWTNCASHDYCWPEDGEIDLMEFLGHELNKLHQNVHWENSEGVHKATPKTTYGTDWSKDWHTYTIEWTSEDITYWIDGEQTHRVQGGPPQIPQVPHYLILNLAVGGGWPGPPDASTPWPSTFEVDYARVWQR